MNNEFKKSKTNNETRYVLETATGGGTSAGSVASVPGALGGVRKREDNILAQEADKTSPKPRNFVAKNAKMGGAGAHKDKSKTIPRKAKHKTPVAEELEGRLNELKNKLAVLEGGDGPADFFKGKPGVTVSNTMRQPNKPDVAPQPDTKLDPANRARMEAELKKLQAELDPNYPQGRYSFQQDEIAKQISRLKGRLAQGVAEATGDERFDTMMGKITGGAGARQGVDNLNKSLAARTGSDPETALAKWGQEFIKWLEDICRNFSRQGVDRFSKLEKLSEFEDGGETMAHWLIEVAKQTKTAGITLADIQEFSSEFNTHGMWPWQQFPIAWSQNEWQDYKDQWTGPDGYIANLRHSPEQGVAEGETSTPEIYVKGGGKYPGMTIAPKGWSRIRDIKDEGGAYFVMVGNDGDGFNIPKDKVSPHKIKLKNGMPITAKQAFMMFNGWTPDREQGVPEGSEIAVDRKTGKVYNPNKELDKLLSQHKAQFQGMAAIEKAQAKKKAPEQKGVAENFENYSKDPSGYYRNLHTGRLHTSPGSADGNDSYMTPSYMLAHYKKQIADIEASKYSRSREVAQIKAKIAKLEKQGVAESSLTDKQQSYWDSVAKEKKNKERAALAAKKVEHEKTPIGKAEKYWGKKGVAEEFNGEYDDEAGMARSNLLTSARAVAGLLKTIKDRDNLPEWSQEKIAKAEMMLVSVWDYLQSQKEQGVDPQVESDAYTDHLSEMLGNMLGEKIPPNADVAYYINDFAKSTAPQFKGKNPAKRKQMAIAAHYSSKQPKKKK